MSTTAAPPTPALQTPKQQLLDAYRREHETTIRVLRAFPRDRTDMKPHAKARTARELAWMFVLEQGAMEKALTTGFDWTARPDFPPAPESFDAVLEALDRGHQKVVEIVERQTDRRLSEPIQFPVAPKTMGEVPRIQFLWTMLCDQIHHRGQFSVYLRMADGKVPSIYGPSLDEPWF